MRPSPHFLGDLVLFFPLTNIENSKEGSAARRKTKLTIPAENYLFPAPMTVIRHAKRRGTLAVTRWPHRPQFDQSCRGGAGQQDGPHWQESGLFTLALSQRANSPSRGHNHSVKVIIPSLGALDTLSPSQLNRLPIRFRFSPKINQTLNDRPMMWDSELQRLPTRDQN